MSVNTTEAQEVIQNQVVPLFTRALFKGLRGSPPNAQRCASSRLGSCSGFPLLAVALQFFPHGQKRAADGFLKRFLGLASGKGCASHITHQSGRGYSRTLFMVAVFFQNHPGMKDILMPILKAMQARFDFLLPTGSHGKITAFGPNVHCSPSDPQLS
jgi:hypothetical protein